MKSGFTDLRLVICLLSDFVFLTTDFVFLITALLELTEVGLASSSLLATLAFLVVFRVLIKLFF